MSCLGSKGLEFAFFSGRWKARLNGIGMQPEELKIGPNSVDVTLGKTFMVRRLSRAQRALLRLHGMTGLRFESLLIDPRNSDSIEWEKFEGESIDLWPGDFILGHTRESFDTNVQIENRYWKQDYDGRSTTGRLSINSHHTAGKGDWQFNGQWTLEISCSMPVRLYHGMRIGQIHFTEIVSPGKAYDGAYVGQVGPRVPELGRHRF